MENEAAISGLHVRVDHVMLKGIVTAVPASEVKNDLFHAQFGEAAVNEIVKMIGVQTRRHSNDQQTTADFCQAAAQKLMSELAWSPESIDAIVFVSQTPDYRLPATACALQSRLKLRTSCAALDINLGCSGYVYGLWLASKLIDGHAVRRVLLLAGDTSSKLVNPADRATAMLFGDAGSATALEFNQDAQTTYFVLGTDGTGEKNLIVPKGAYRKFEGVDPRMVDSDLTCLYMDGADVFNFTLKSVPPLVNDLLDFSVKQRDEVNWYFFHQANQFMLKHITKKLKLPAEKAPMNIDRFGNTSSASIPLVMTDVGRDQILRGTAVLTGFGVGYSWASALITLDQMQVNSLIEI